VIFPPGLLSSLEDAVKTMWDVIALVLSLSINYNGLDLTKYLIGNSFGLSLNLPFYVAVFIFIFALVFPRLRKNGVPALVVLIGMPVLGFLWFFALDQVQQIGDLLKKVALGISLDGTANVGGILDIKIPSISPSDPVVLGVVIIMTIYTQILMVSLSFGYEPLNVALACIGVFVLALSGLGERTQKFFAFLISMFVVSGLLGVPIMIAFIRIAKIIVNALPGGDGFAIFGSIIMWFFATVSIVLQYVIGWAAYQRAKEVVGRVVARLQNTKLRSIFENKSRLDMQLAGRTRSTVTNRFDLMRVKAVNYGVDKAEDFKRKQTAALTQKLRTVATGAVGAAGATIPHPVAKIGAPILIGIINAVGNKPLPRAKPWSEDG